MPRRDPEYIRALKGKKPRLPFEMQVRFPIQEAAKVEPPPYLDDAALVHWARMVEILDSVRLIQAPSRDKLGRYCQACADYEALQMERKKAGSRKHTVTERNHEQLQYWARMMREYEKTMESFEGEYGLTPASAAKVRHPGASMKPGEKLAEFIDTKPQLE